MKLLELFSGTHSIGKVCEERGIDVVSLDRDLPEYDIKDKTKAYKSKHHIKADIMKWDYKKDFNPGDFDIISASPVCSLWSQLRKSWINSYYNPETMKFKRKPQEGFIKFTHQVLQDDIDKYGKPMVDKVLEIIDYFKPKYWWIENPKSSSMKDYLFEKGLKENRVVSYCRYGFPYQKHTRIWSNFEFENKICNNDCDMMVEIDNKKFHLSNCGNQKCERRTRKHLKNSNQIGGGGNPYTRYRLPPPLVNQLLECCV